MDEIELPRLPSGPTLVYDDAPNSIRTPKRGPRLSDLTELATLVRHFPSLAPILYA